MNKVLAFTFAALCFCSIQQAVGQSMMRMYRSVYSVAGFYSNGRNSVDIDQGAGIRAMGISDHEKVRLSSRNGYFLYRHLAFGGEISWEQESMHQRPDPNPLNFRAQSRDRRLFIGPWVRWYVPASVRWYTALEMSAGYVHARGEQDESTSAYILPRSSTSANGFGLNAGFSMGYFLSRGVALDATMRYSAGWLEGVHAVAGSPDRDLSMEYHEFVLLLGVQFML
jgi:hypothetical protein